MSNVRLVTVFLVTASLSFHACSEDKPNEPGVSVPTLTTAAVTAVTQTTATCGGNVTADGGAAPTARGVCWSTDALPTVADSTTTDGTGSGAFVSSLTDLAANTPYHVRAYATNSAGTGYGDDVPFATPPAGGTVTDIDGNEYLTVLIGTQEWMAANLEVTHYRNGDAIPNVTGNVAWQGLTSGAYCEYNNEAGSVDTYGRLYNWHAVADARGLAPEGWHVPSVAEWQTLIDALGGNGVAGGKMKEAGTAHWASPNTDASNESGFSALPGGHRNWDGAWLNLGFYTWFWSSSEVDALNAWYRFLTFDAAGTDQNSYLKLDGFSIRCVKD